MERGRGANRNDRQTVDSVAQQKGMDSLQRRAFGKYIEDVKRSEGRGGADNFTYRVGRERGSPLASSRGMKRDTGASYSVPYGGKPSSRAERF